MEISHPICTDHISIYSGSQYIFLATRTVSYTDNQYLESIHKFSVVSNAVNSWKHTNKTVQGRPPASTAHQNFRVVDVMISVPAN